MAACSQCGREDRLFERGRCAPCALARRVSELCTGPGGEIPAALVAVCDVIAASDPPFAALNWLRTGAGAPILAALASGTMALTHEALDIHPRPRAAGYVRQLLVVHGALPERNESPRAIHYCLNAARDSLHAISGTPIGTYRHGAEKLLGQLCSDLAYANIDDVMAAGLHEYLDDLQTKMNQVSAGIYDTFFAKRVPEARHIAKERVQ